MRLGLIGLKIDATVITTPAARYAGTISAAMHARAPMAKSVNALNCESFATGAAFSWCMHPTIAS
jgi:hypothetical protein